MVLPIALSLASLPGVGEVWGPVALCVLMCAQTWLANRCVMSMRHISSLGPSSITLGYGIL